MSQPARRDDAAPSGAAFVFAGLSPKRVGRFVVAHGWLAVLGPGFAVAQTAVHEWAHALMAMALGIHVSSVRVLPGVDAEGFFFGMTMHDPVDGVQARLIAAAPALLALATSALALIALRPRRPSRLAQASMVGFWLLPLVDLSLSLAGLLSKSPRADLVQALEPQRALALVVGGGVLLIHGGLGYGLVRKVTSASLSRLEFSLAYVGLLLAPWARWLWAKLA